MQYYWHHSSLSAQTQKKYSFILLNILLLKKNDHFLTNYVRKYSIPLFRYLHYCSRIVFYCTELHTLLYFFVATKSVFSSSIDIRTHPIVQNIVFHCIVEVPHFERDVTSERERKWKRSPMHFVSFFYKNRGFLSSFVKE